jgi:hypothetical protein
MRGIFAGILAVLWVAPMVRGGDPMIVHEWGTFTSLQDENGQAIGGVNSDDEPVPGFVHHPVDFVRALAGGKGIPARDPEVTMRLETPVLYFYSAPGAGPEPVDVSVSFHGGWLTEYYPDAEVPAPDLSHHLTGATTGSLVWHDVHVGVKPSCPATSDVVWSTPRKVGADGVAVGAESERFLFYRGVGHVDSPISVKREVDGKVLAISPWSGLGARLPMWLVDVREDGTLAWRRIGEKPGSSAPATTAADFPAGEYSIASPGLLHRDMARGLREAGLFPDEAEAMLDTWQLSYFKSPGTRLFYILPRSWTDSVLPLQITGNPTITRVMVGRIELVTPRHRALLAAMRRCADDAEAWKDYQRLGRFRDALVLEDAQANPAPSLSQFMQAHSILAFQIP